MVITKEGLGGRRGGAEFLFLIVNYSSVIREDATEEPGRERVLSIAHTPIDSTAMTSRREGVSEGAVGEGGGGFIQTFQIECTSISRCSAGSEGERGEGEGGMRCESG